MKIKIAGHTDWDVKVVNAHDPLLIVDGVPCRGAAWCGNQTIALSNELSDRTKHGVVMHELTHAFLWSTQMSVPSEFDEEQVCNFVSLWSHDIQEAATKILDNWEMLSNDKCSTQN